MDTLPPRQCLYKPRPALSFSDFTSYWLRDLSFGLPASQVTFCLSVPDFHPPLPPWLIIRERHRPMSLGILSSQGSICPYCQVLTPLSHYSPTSSSDRDYSNHPIQQIRLPITTLAPHPRSQDLFVSSMNPCHTKQATFALTATLKTSLIQVQGFVGPRAVGQYPMLRSILVYRLSMNTDATN